jgi:hypothetical protein
MADGATGALLTQAAKAYQKRVRDEGKRMKLAEEQSSGEGACSPWVPAKDYHEGMWKSCKSLRRWPVLLALLVAFGGLAVGLVLKQAKVLVGFCR